MHTIPFCVVFDGTIVQKEEKEEGRKEEGGWQKRGGKILEDEGAYQELLSIDR